VSDAEARFVSFWRRRPFTAETGQGRFFILPLFLGLFISELCTGVAVHAAELEMWVVESTTEGREERHYGKGLEAIHRVLAPVPHDTYKKVASGKHKLAASKTTRVPINKSYTLETAPPITAKDGRHRLKLRILMKKEGTPPKEIAALSTELLLHLDKPVVVRGLKAKGKVELVLVLALSEPPKAKG
jgi:hypothetical protein